jgi:hypothetical protein
VEIKTSRGPAPPPSFFSPLIELSPRFTIQVSTGVIETHTKLPDGSLLVTVPKNFWSTVHVTFDSQKRSPPASASFVGVDAMQSAITHALLTLLPGEIAFFYGEGTLPKRESAFSHRDYRQLFFASPLPATAGGKPLELMTVVVRN